MGGGHPRRPVRHRGGLCGGPGLALKGGAKVIRPMFFVVLTLLVVRLVWDLLA